MHTVYPEIYQGDSVEIMTLPLATCQDRKTVFLSGKVTLTDTHLASVPLTKKDHDHGESC